MLRESGFLTEFRRILYTVMGIVGRPYCIYGDPAYPIVAELQAPYRYRLVVLTTSNESLELMA